MPVKNYKELQVWQKSIELVTIVYKLTELLPKEEIHALSNQIRRAVVSVPSNIAEGQQRNSTKDFIRFLSISKGSNAEVQTQLIICTRLNYLSNEQIEQAMNLSDEVGKMLSVLINKLSTH